MEVPAIEKGPRVINQKISSVAIFLISIMQHASLKLVPLAV